MPSRSLHAGRTAGRAALDEIESAHAAIGGTGPGRRTATLQVNYAYAVLLSSQFKRFCRGLHAEACAAIVAGVQPIALRTVLLTHMDAGRKLNTGNPNPGNLGSDFQRFGLDLWPALYTQDSRNQVHRRALDRLNVWRNAIAHQDFDPAHFPSPRLGIATVRQWRRACDGLAGQLDLVVARHLRTIRGVAPW